MMVEQALMEENKKNTEYRKMIRLYGVNDGCKLQSQVSRRILYLLAIRKCKEVNLSNK